MEKKIWELSMYPSFALLGIDKEGLLSTDEKLEVLIARKHGRRNYHEPFQYGSAMYVYFTAGIK